MLARVPHRALRVSPLVVLGFALALKSSSDQAAGDRTNGVRFSKSLFAQFSRERAGNANVEGVRLSWPGLLYHSAFILGALRRVLRHYFRDLRFLMSLIFGIVVVAFVRSSRQARHDSPVCARWPQLSRS